MSESVNFIQGRKEQYNPSEMQGGLFFSKDSKEILLNGESYGNAMPADEEDITAESGNLKLKDRAYDEANFSGKGYVILRKNIQEVTVPKFDLTITNGCTTNGNITINTATIAVTTQDNTPELIAQKIQSSVTGTTIDGATITFTSNPTIDYSNTGITGNIVDNSYQTKKNILTQAMINQPNTIYEVRYNFCLNGTTVRPLQGSKFIYNGGTINEGIISISQENVIISPNGTDIIFKRFAASCMNEEDISYYNDCVGVKDAILSKDKTFGTFNAQDTQDLSALFHLNGRGHSIVGIRDCRIITPNLYVENTVFGKADQDNIIFGNYYSHSATKDIHGGNLICKNCTFYNLTTFNTSALNVKFLDCNFINCSIHVGLSKDQYEYGSNMHTSFIGCQFFTGSNNADNTEVIHAMFHGWEGSVTIDKCAFISEEDFQIGDIIDGYDTCNINITNCNFTYKYIPNGGEGTINIKSHSEYKEEEVDWAYVDEIGNKYNTVIANNNFSVILEQSSQEWFKPVIWIRSHKRPNYVEGDTWNPRYNFNVTNNNLYIRCNFQSYISGCMIYNQDTLDNAVIVGNNITIEGSSPSGDFSIFGHQFYNGRMTNIIIANNIIQQIKASTINLSPIRFFSTENYTSEFINIIVQQNTVIGKISSQLALEQYKNISIINNLCYDTTNDSRLGLPIIQDVSQFYKIQPGSQQYVIGENKLGILQYSGEVLDAFGNPISAKLFGDTSIRPGGVLTGFQYFDTTLNKPIWWNGTQWVDATENISWATIE